LMRKHCLKLPASMNCIIK